jgi:hypothetical protein
MDPGRVVWLPDGGFSESDATQACQQMYGNEAYACGAEPYPGSGWLVYCC